MRLDARRPPRSAGARRSKGPKLNPAIELTFALAARALYARVAAAMKSAVLPRVKEFAKEKKLDAKGSEKEQASAAKAVSRHAREVARRALRTGLPAFEARSKKAAEKAHANSKSEFERLGWKVKKEPVLKWLVDGWRKDNVARITDLADHQAQQIERLLARAMGRDPENLAKDIEELAGVGPARAELIARDQVQKLNAQITRHRAEAAGSESYVWTTQGDDRVRDEHEALDGEEFTWESGGDPEEGHPGDAPNCRCLAYPIVPEPSEVEPSEDEDEDA